MTSPQLTSYSMVKKTGRFAFKIRNNTKGLPWHAVAKNPPAKAGDSGSIPGPGRFHMTWSS